MTEQVMTAPVCVGGYPPRVPCVCGANLGEDCRRPVSTLAALNARCIVRLVPLVEMEERS